MRWLGVPLAAVPFAFALIRLLTTGDDMRYLWMAIASTLCAAGVMVRPGSTAVLRGVHAGVATIAAAAGAALVGVALGARAGPGIAMVSVSFGFCSALGTWLLVRRGAQASG